jgi:hypothetical protein
MVYAQSINQHKSVQMQFGYRDESECNGWADHAPPFVSELVASDLAEHYG